MKTLPAFLLLPQCDMWIKQMKGGNRVNDARSQSVGSFRDCILVSPLQNIRDVGGSDVHEIKVCLYTFWCISFQLRLERCHTAKESTVLPNLTTMT